MSMKARMFSMSLYSLKERTNLFYLLAAAPLLLIVFYNLWSLIICFYGFIFLLLKSQKLRQAGKAKLFQEILGFIVVASSFLVYYLLRTVVPTAGFYGSTNYIVFILGLFLIFFDISTLKEAVTPLFFISAATGSSIIAEWLKPCFSPHLGSIAHLIASVLRAFGINANVYDSGGMPVFRFRSLTGNLVGAAFAYECIGVSSALIFSIILVVVLYEDKSSWKVRLLASGIGVLGTFALNIIRVIIILATDYLYGAEVGSMVHYVIGYALFSSWLVIFIYAYSKRRVIRLKLKSIQRDGLSKRA